MCSPTTQPCGQLSRRTHRPYVLFLFPHPVEGPKTAQCRFGAGHRLSGPHCLRHRGCPLRRCARSWDGASRPVRRSRTLATSLGQGVDCLGTRIEQRSLRMRSCLRPENLPSDFLQEVADDLAAGLPTCEATRATPHQGRSQSAMTCLFGWQSSTSILYV